MSTKRVLCVDDDESIRDLLTTLLGLSQLEAVSSPNLSEALELMAREKFSLYVLDGQMSGVTGLSLCEQIRAADPNTPIIIFSGAAHQIDIDAGILAGANAYLVKPDSSALIATIKRLLESPRASVMTP